MCVIVDMVNAVAVIALTAGAVPELQIRIRYIRPTADGAAVGIGFFGLNGGGFISACIWEGNHLGTGLLI